MTTAWYPIPETFSPIPVGRSSTTNDEKKEEHASDEDGNDDDEVSEEGILKSVEYICMLIDKEVEKGVKPERIVVGGFSQGCAVSLVLGLAAGRYQGRLAGVVGLSGYLPKGKGIKKGRREYAAKLESKDGSERMRIFLGHGTKDMLIPVSIP